MYLYFIERFQDDSEFEGAFKNCRIKGKVYDVVKAKKDTGLDKISTHIIDFQHKLFMKTNPRESTQIQKCAESIIGKMNELLFD